MRTPLTTTAVALVLAAPLVVCAPAAAASCTAPEVVSASVAPGTVVLGTTVAKGFVVSALVRTNGCALAQVDAEIATPTGTTSLVMAKDQTTDGITTYDVGVRVEPGAVNHADAGTWTTRTSVSWAGSTVVHAGPDVHVLRATRLRINATPEPVRVGRTITVRGTLTLASWATPHYAGLAGRRVQLQSRAVGSTGYAAVRTLTTNRSGAVRTTLTARRDTCYRFVYRGSATTAKVVATPDCVDVR